jgi:uncharacterized protein YukE
MPQWQVGANVGQIQGLHAAQSGAHAAIQGILNDAHQLALQTRANWAGAGEAEFGQVETQFTQHSQAVQDAFNRLITTTNDCAANWSNTCNRLATMW